MARIASLGCGLLLGFVLSRVGFTDYGELHAMFTFHSLRMIFVFAGAVVLTGIAYRLLPQGRMLGPRRISKSVVVGGILFGVGWAICGACPGAAFAQLGEGKLFALVSLLGMVVGSRMFGAINSRFLKWDTDPCGT